MSKPACILLTLLIGAFAAVAAAQGRPDPATMIAAQREAMAAFKNLDGVWRGPAWSILPSGEKHHITQTERIGPFLDGSVKVIEGRGYEANGKVSFNAFGTISFNPATRVYTLHSYAMGNVGDFLITPTGDGYVWEIPAGPMKIRYTAVISGDDFKEVGDQIQTGKEPVRIFEMTLKRLGDSKWPAEGAVTQK